MPFPLVSVCVLTYNHVHFIRECIEGIMMQKTNFDVEVVVGDDFSVDGTRDVLRELETQFPQNLKVIYQKENVGGAKNGYLYCYPELRGAYIAICEGDDFWTDENKLQKQMDFLLGNPEFSFCFHRVNNVDVASKVLSSQSPLDAPVFYSSEQIFHISIPTLSVVFKKPAGHISNDILSVQSGDTFLFGLLAADGKAADLGFVGASYRTHPGGAYSSKKLVEQVKQGIHTRKIMLKSSAFSLSHKLELKKEILKRKTMFIKYFLKKRQLVNTFKVAFA